MEAKDQKILYTFVNGINNKVIWDFFQIARFFVNCPFS